MTRCMPDGGVLVFSSHFLKPNLISPVVIFFSSGGITLLHSLRICVASRVGPTTSLPWRTCSASMLSAVKGRASNISPVVNGVPLACWKCALFLSSRIFFQIFLIALFLPLVYAFRVIRVALVWFRVDYVGNPSRHGLPHAVLYLSKLDFLFHMVGDLPQSALFVLVRGKVPDGVFFFFLRLQGESFFL